MSIWQQILPALGTAFGGAIGLSIGALWIRWQHRKEAREWEQQDRDTEAAFIEALKTMRSDIEHKLAELKAPYN